MWPPEGTEHLWTQWASSWTQWRTHISGTNIQNKIPKLGWTIHAHCGYGNNGSTLCSWWSRDIFLTWLLWFMLPRYFSFERSTLRSNVNTTSFDNSLLTGVFSTVTPPESTLRTAWPGCVNPGEGAHSLSLSASSCRAFIFWEVKLASFRGTK